MATLSSLPFEVLQCIYDYLDWTDQWHCLQVSHIWYNAFHPLVTDPSVTLDKPELFWSFLETHKQRSMSYIRELTLAGLPIIYGLDAVVKNCIDLKALTLRSLDVHHPMYALYAPKRADDVDMDSPSTPSDIGHFTITDALIFHAHSLTSLMLDYPILVDMHPLFTAIPPGLGIFKLHQICSSVDVVDLALLYDTCHRLKILSLKGDHFTATSGSTLPHAVVSNNDNDSSLVSLDLVFKGVSALCQIVDFISAVQPNRHCNLRHIGLSMRQTASPDNSLNDTPQHLYDHLVNQCLSLTSLSMGRYTPHGLVEALERRKSSHGILLQQLSLNEEFYLYPALFTYNVVRMAGNISSLALLGTIEMGDVIPILHWLDHFERLEHLELDCFSPHAWPLTPHEMEIQDFPFNLSSPENPRSSMLHDIRSVVYTARLHWQRSPSGYGHRVCPDHSPACFQWLLRGPGSRALVSLKLQKSSPIYELNSVWLAIGLEKLVLFKASLDPTWMSLLKLLSSLVDLHLDLCSCAYPAMLLDLSLAVRFSRLEISRLCINGYRRFPGFTNNLLGQLCLYKLSTNDDSYVKQVFSIRANQRHDKPCKQLLVVCRSMDSLIVNQKNYLG